MVVDDYDNEDSVAIIPEYGSGRAFKMQIYWYKIDIRSKNQKKSMKLFNFLADG